MDKNFQKNTLKPRCTLAPDGRSGRTTQYMRLAPAVALPYSATTFKMIKYGCSGTSHILERCTKLVTKLI